MLHLFLEKGPWFRAKSYGYGTGLPFKWQGWALLAAHVATLAGIAFVMPNQSVTTLILVLLTALAPLPIYRARTEGGWRWRTGGVEEGVGGDRDRENG